MVCGFDVRTLPRKGVHDGQDLEHSSILKLIKNEVVAPDVASAHTEGLSAALPGFAEAMARLG